MNMAFIAPFASIAAVDEAVVAVADVDTAVFTVARMEGRSVSGTAVEASEVSRPASATPLSATPRLARRAQFGDTVTSAPLQGANRATGQRRCDLLTVILQVSQNNRLPVSFRQTQQRGIHESEHSGIELFGRRRSEILNRLVFRVCVFTPDSVHALPHGFGCHMMRHPVQPRGEIVFA
jgi:hypothetical protein